MAIEFEVKGFEELFKKMEVLKEEIGKGKTDRIWRNALNFAMEPVLQDAIAYAPYDPKSKDGHLKDHIYMRVHRPMARDKVSGSYVPGEIYMARITASTLRDSTTADVILNKKGRFQTVYKNKKPVPISMEFGNARVPAQPFLRVALSSNVENVQSRLAQALMEQIKLLSKG